MDQLAAMFFEFLMKIFAASISADCLKQCLGKASDDNKSTDKQVLNQIQSIFKMGDCFLDGFYTDCTVVKDLSRFLNFFLA